MSCMHEDKTYQDMISIYSTTEDITYHPRRWTCNSCSATGRIVELEYGPLSEAAYEALTTGL
jgi:hypothetical protein